MPRHYFKEFSPEERKINLELARVARGEKIEAGKCLRQDWADSPLWDYLRSEIKIKCPPYYLPSTEIKYYSRTMKKIGKDTSWLKEHFAPSVSKWNEWNKNVPAYVLQGLLLEAAYPELVHNRKGENDECN